jgi:hypothetical protein
MRLRKRQKTHQNSMLIEQTNPLKQANIKLLLVITLAIVVLGADHFFNRPDRPAGAQHIGLIIK